MGEGWEGGGGGGGKESDTGFAPDGWSEFERELGPTLSDVAHIRYR